MQVRPEDRITPQKKRNDSSAFISFIVIALLVVAVVVYYFFGRETPPEPTAEPIAIVTTTDVAPAQPLPTDAAVPEPKTKPVAVVKTPTVSTNKPVTAPATATSAKGSSQAAAASDKSPQTPLPVLNESDDYVYGKAIEIANNMRIENILINKDIIRRFVVFVDNIAQGKLARKSSPFKAPVTVFSVLEISNKTYLDPDSYHRYDLYADFIANLDTTQVEATYRRLMPLLDSAFKELGYDNIQFNQRVIAAIDVILTAPVVEQAMELSSVSVNYRFVDPALEALPAAQKLMLRMGPNNSKKIQTALKKLKQQIQ